MGEHVRPMLVERDRRWWGQARHIASLQARIGVLLGEISRLSDRG